MEFKLPHKTCLRLERVPSQAKLQLMPSKITELTGSSLATPRDASSTARHKRSSLKKCKNQRLVDSELSIAVERLKHRDMKNKPMLWSMSNCKLLKMQESVTGTSVSLSTNHCGPWEPARLLVQTRLKRPAK